MSADHDGRFVHIDGRRWRATDPSIPAPFRTTGQPGLSVRRSHRDDGSVRVDSGVEHAAVRPRLADDLAACVELVRVVHQQDRYPIRLPDDVRGFLESRHQLAAWVVEHESVVVGHVALHRPSSTPMTTLVCEVRAVRPCDIGVVSRLMVSPDARGHGLGRALLNVATAEARRRGMLPALDVVTRYAAAIALYEAQGWQRIGRVAIPMPDGELVDEYVYVPSTGRMVE
jgi:GNAT superfamily N-acetyltransferase